MKPSSIIESAAERHKLELCAYDLLAVLIEQHGPEKVLAVLRYWLVVTTMQEEGDRTKRKTQIGK